METNIMLMFCRITILLVFVMSVGGKMLDVTSFQEALLDFRLLPQRLTKVVAWVFLSLEVAVVAFLVIGRLVLLIGFVLAGGLLTLFSVALVTVLRRNIRVACNCFGRTERQISIYDVGRNVILILCSLIGVGAMAGAAQHLSLFETGLIGIMAISFVVVITNLADVVPTLHKPFETQG